MEFSRPEYWSGLPFPSPGDLSNPATEPRSPTLQADSLPAELPGKPKNTGVGSLSLLQGIFPTQESNQDLLHCRRILYQLSYEGSPKGKTVLKYGTWLMLKSKTPAPSPLVTGFESLLCFGWRAFGELLTLFVTAFPFISIKEKIIIPPR